MAVQMFAAIYIGSYDVSLKIFEFTQKKKNHEIDYIRSRLELGRDVFTDGSIGYERVEELCDTLKAFLHILQGYKVEKYEVYASSVIREASNELFVLDQIFLRTGVQVKVMSNSEHRFISYKSMAGRAQFEKMIQATAAVVDVGGDGVQITLFREGQIITTQYMNIGTIRLSSFMDEGYTMQHYEQQMEEYINKNIEVFRKRYLPEDVGYCVFLNDYCRELVKRMDKNYMEENLIRADKFVKFIEKLLGKNLEEISAELNLSNDKDPWIMPSMLLFRAVAVTLGAEEIWVPGMNINDGIAYDYAQRNRLVRETHDFEADILSASVNLARHYQSYTPGTEALSALAVLTYDTMKKIHGLGKRERLLLQVASILHDCGRYVSISGSPTCAYHIIMASEIIGLTHKERRIVALTVLHSSLPLEDYSEWKDKIDKDSYLVVAKLSAILRVANALDQSHRQKYKSIRVSVRGRELVFTIETMKDLSLKQRLFGSKTLYFEKIFSIKPVIKVKRVYSVE